jgi:quercetin dioxygenase-like cupin family protein
MAEDAVKVAPHAYKVLLENDRVRVLESRMKPGDRTEMHSHPALVAYAIQDGRFKFTFPDGASEEIELQAGQVIFSDAVTHSTENVGTTEGHVILVELK